MKITSFNPVIVTHDPESAVKLFEEPGFEIRLGKKYLESPSSINGYLLSPSGFMISLVKHKKK